MSASESFRTRVIFRALIYGRRNEAIRFQQLGSSAFPVTHIAECLAGTACFLGACQSSCQKLEQSCDTRVFFVIFSQVSSPSDYVAKHASDFTCNSKWTISLQESNTSKFTFNSRKLVSKSDGLWYHWDGVSIRGHEVRNNRECLDIIILNYRI